MSDKPNSPTKPETPDPKVDKGDTKDGLALPKNQQMTVGQQVLIWSLVLFVGILFGAGPIADTLLGNTNQVGYVGNISEHDIMSRQGVARRLQDILNPQRDQSGEMFEPSSYDRRGRQLNVHEVWADRIKLTRYAESQGLLPGGSALDALVKEFLNKPLPGNPAKRYVEALEEVKGGDKAVTLDQVSRHLAEERARQLVTMARIVAPVVPTAMGDAVNTLPPMSQMDYYNGLRGDQVVVDEVILTAKALLPEVKDDDAEIAIAYERLKDRRFTRPAALETTIAYVDVPALAAKTAVADGDVEAYYKAHLDDYRKPVVPPKPEEAKPDAATPDAAKPEDKKPEVPAVEYKPLAEVAADIKAKLAKERAEQQAKEMVRQLDTALDNSEVLLQKDNIAFKAKAAELGLMTREKVFLEEPKSGGTLDTGEFGMLSETQLHLFNQEMNFITSAVQSTGDKATWLVLRIDARREAGFRDLSDPAVKAEVKAVLAGERAYKDLLAKAEEIRAGAEKLGPGGLKRWTESEAAKTWEAKATSNTLSSLTQISPPANEVGGLAAADGPLLAAMAMPTRPVALGNSPAQADVPAVRLVQVTAYQAAPPVTGESRSERAATYRGMLENYRYSLFQRELAAELQKN